MAHESTQEAKRNARNDYDTPLRAPQAGFSPAITNRYETPPRHTWQTAPRFYINADINADKSGAYTKDSGIRSGLRNMVIYNGR